MTFPHNKTVTVAHWFDTLPDTPALEWKPDKKTMLSTLRWIVDALKDQSDCKTATFIVRRKLANLELAK